MATAKVIIAGQNNIGPAVKSAQGDISSLTNVAQKAGDTLKKAFTVTAILAALKKLGDGCAACFNSFWEAERKYNQLQIALGNTNAYNQAVTTIKNLSRQTLSSKSDIESMVSELAALGKSSDEIDKISSAAVYLSNVNGKDLNSSMTTLLGTYNGTTTQLRKLGIDVSDLTKEQLAQGAAVDTVISKLKVYSDQLAEIDTRQHVNNINNAWGDIKQSKEIEQCICSLCIPNLDIYSVHAEKERSEFSVNVFLITDRIRILWFRLLQKSIFDALKTLNNARKCSQNSTQGTTY